MEEIFINSYNLPKQLNEDEVLELINKINVGDINAKNKFIEHNIRLVLKRVCTKFKLIDYDKKELVAIGIIGLIKAVNTFDVNKHSKFSSYAYKCIYNEILIFLRNLYRKNKVRIISFEEDIATNVKQLDILKSYTNVEQEYIDKETKTIIKIIINELPIKQQKIIKMYFGFDDYNYSKKEDIAKELGISRAYFYSELKKILNKIKFKLLNDNVYVLNNKKY